MKKENLEVQLEKLQTKASLYHSLSESRGDLLFIIECELSNLGKANDLEQVKAITNKIKSEMKKYSNHNISILEKIMKINKEEQK